MIEAQKAGKNPALCDPNSQFQTDLTSCNQCVLANGNTTNATLATYTQPEFAQFIDFCAANSTASPSQQSYILSQQSQASLVSSLEAQYSSLGLLSSLTVTQAYTTVVTQVPSSTSSITRKSFVSNPAAG